jgi:hypothetical protein
MSDLEPVSEQVASAAAAAAAAAGLGRCQRVLPGVVFMSSADVLLKSKVVPDA